MHWRLPLFLLFKWIWLLSYLLSIHWSVHPLTHPSTHLPFFQPVEYLSSSEYAQNTVLVSRGCLFTAIFFFSPSATIKGLSVIFSNSIHPKMKATFLKGSSAEVGHMCFAVPCCWTLWCRLSGPSSLLRGPWISLAWLRSVTSPVSPR